MCQLHLARPTASRIAGLLLVGLIGLPATAAADGGVRLHAVARDGGPALTDGVVFEVWARDGKQAVRKVAESNGAPAELALAPDEYRVVTTYRQARKVTDIVVPDGAAVSRTVSLNLGRLKLELLPAPGAEPVRRNVAWTVRPYRRGGGPADPIARTQDPVPELGLSAGWYRVAAQHGADSYSHVVQVAAGRSLTYSLFAK